MEHREHTWTEWKRFSQVVRYSDGLYLETWWERSCTWCYVSERSNYSREKIGE